MRRGKTAGAYRRFAAGLTVLLLLLSLTACGKEQAWFVDRGDSMDCYPTVIRKAMPDYPQRSLRDLENGFVLVQDGCILEQFDVQALSALRSGVGGYWYPQVLATPVIAVDREKTHADIRGWKDLEDAHLDVAWVDDGGIAERLVLGAMSYGLEGDEFTDRSAIDLLTAIADAGHFRRSGQPAPVMICFDYQAAALKDQGRKLDIVVPREGTLSYAVGLLSPEQLTVPADEALLSAGLRLLDGRCTNPAYPDKASYGPAERLNERHAILSETAYAHRDITRQVRHERLYSAADGQGYIMTAAFCVVALLLWMGTAVHRSIRPEICRAVRLTSVQIALWLCLRLVKYQLDAGSVVNRYCWYGYYIFQIGLPLTLLYLASIVDRPETGGAPPRWVQRVALGYPVLLALVFTNDLHFLVFRMDLNGNFSENYSYGPGYYAVYAYCMLTFLVALLLLIRKSRKNPRRRAWLLPAGVSVLILGYTVGYALGAPIARNSDYTVTFCFLAVLFLETTLHTGLVPANTRYDEFFSLSPLDMQLLDSEGRTALAGKYAAELEPLLRMQLCAREHVSTMRDRNTRLFGRSVRGGTVVWQEDISPVNRLREEIEAAVKRLKAANTILQNERQVRRRRLDAAARLELLDILEQEIREDTDELGDAIEQLKTSPDRERQTAYITLVLCHVKRRCNLFFLAREGQDMPIDELAMYIDELAEFAQYAGVRALNRCGVTHPVSISRATLCYDFVFTVLAWSVRDSRATLLGQVEEKQGGLEYSILLSESADSLDFPLSFLQTVENAGGSIRRRELDEDTGIYLRFPGEEGKP